VTALVLVACNQHDNAAPVAPEQGQASDPEERHRAGFQHAKAMVENAERCEPARGEGDVAACQRACELNHSNSCANWGRFFAGSDDARASALYRRSCKGGSGIGCEAEARMSQAAGRPEAEAQFTGARNYHRVHCSQGYARSCSQLASLLEQGLGGTTDAATAKSFRKRACLLGRGSDC
jgi:hypothetical protein